MSTWDPAALMALIEEATIDAYGEDEQLTGFFTMIEEYLAVPFTTTVLGVDVSVVGVDLAEDGCVIARCLGGGPTGHRNSEPAAAGTRPRGLAVDRGIPLLGPLNWRVAQVPN
ncbi:hypothetical protein ACGFZQ_40865 [Streptomyces sp. NPDC048254]|uniref:hypothetical protein n=1 Tax=Streptomyces sp. NPDC048254 TaxID=3365525 RepID=UPI003716B433